MRVLLLTFIALATPAAAADQFDLVCTAKKDAARYRIDLAAREYCFGKCDKIQKISDVTSGMITLYDEKPSPPDNEVQYNRINRLTGEWSWYGYSPKLSARVMDIKGICKAETFSGFGLMARKF